MSIGNPVGTADGGYAFAGGGSTGFLPSIPPPELPVQAMAFRILDPFQRRSPTCLTVTVSGAWENGPIDFWIDLEVSAPIYTVIADADGVVDALSIPVEEVDPGDHVLIAKSVSLDITDPNRYDSADFNLQYYPAPVMVVGRDADPVEVPGALNDDGSRNWVLQDLMPGGLGSYLFPRNPNSFTTPITFRDLAARHTTSVEGQHHISEAHDQTIEYVFGGLIFTEEEQRALENYWNLDRRIYLIDHENRAWIVALARVEFTHRLRSWYTLPGEPETLSDWLADYSITANVYGTWRDPVPLL